MIASAIGGHVPNSYPVVTLFGVDGLSLIIVDGSWSSRCLNYHIDVPNKIGSFSSGSTTSMVVKNGTFHTKSQNMDKIITSRRILEFKVSK